MNDDRHTWAIHESGHAVIAICVGAAFDYVALQTDDESNGHLMIEVAALDALAPLDAACICAAGAVTQAFFAGASKTRLLAADNDQFERAIAREPEATRAAIRHEAFVKSLAFAMRYRAAIEETAAALELFDTLDHAECSGIFERELVT